MGIMTNCNSGPLVVMALCSGYVRDPHAQQRDYVAKAVAESAYSFSLVFVS